ncbi:MAG: hypothetical protein EXS33_05195 [Pedosphaera sp.]|nr:hypothetical protein [Pedosphaera sp.]
MKWNEPINQFSPRLKSRRLFPSLSPENNTAVCNTFVTQALSVLIGGLILDGGQFAKILCFASLVWWPVFLRILITRPRTEERWDRIFLKAGFPILIAVAFASSPVWGWLRSLLHQ